MPWFYRVNGEQQGPVEETQIAELWQAGQLDGNTPVRTETMSEWQALKDTELIRLQSVSAATGTVCTNCGRTFAANEIIILDGHPTCFECKPIVLRQIEENSIAPVDMIYAGFWVRVVGFFVDGIILGIFNIAIAKMLSLLLPETATSILSSLLNFIMGAWYSCWMLTRYGSTLGMMVVKIKMVNADGSGPISLKTAILRYLVSIVSSILLGIGYLMAAFDSQKRTLHDLACNTRVIYK